MSAANAITGLVWFVFGIGLIALQLTYTPEITNMTVLVAIVLCTSSILFGLINA